MSITIPNKPFSKDTLLGITNCGKTAINELEKAIDKQDVEAIDMWFSRLKAVPEVLGAMLNANNNSKTPTSE